MIARRKLVLALGAAALAPLASFAQQKSKVWRVGFLSYRGALQDVLVQSMRDLGYVEGTNLVVVWRSAESKYERLPGLANELVRLKVDVLVTNGTPAAQAAQKATRVIPIVMSGVGDPVGAGLVKSLARPGGNSTALSLITAELGPKLVGMLRDVVPKAGRVAFLMNPFNDVHPLLLKNIQTPARQLGLKIQRVDATTQQEIANGFAAMARQNAEALIVAQDGFLGEHKTQIAALALKQRLPSVATSSVYVEAGALMSYGYDNRENMKRAAALVDKIFKGTKAGDIPVEQPTTFELFINHKTAAALGIKLPPSILAQATKVIE